MHEFSAEARAAFFDRVFPASEDSEMGQAKLRGRDYLAIDLLGKPDTKNRILDFGCGQGRLLAHMLSLGHDAHGMEPHVGMAHPAEAAVAKLGGKERLTRGGIEELKNLPDKSFTHVVSLGVMQYLSNAEYSEAVEQIERILVVGGKWIVTFQNALFDLFTFNKYTIDCFEHTLYDFYLPESEREEFRRALSSLMTSPTAPAYSKDRARDNIFVRLSNPLLIAGAFPGWFKMSSPIAFYEWYGVPPLMKGKCSRLVHDIVLNFEKNDPHNWRGHFLANAFLCEFEKTGYVPPLHPQHCI